QAQATIEGRTGGSLDGVTGEMQIGAGNRIDLLFRSPVTKGDHDRKALHVAFVAAESLLGEKALDRWGGAITVSRAGGDGKAVRLDRLKDTFDSLVNSIRDRLPDRPFVERPDEDKWAGIQLKPAEANDYPGRADLLVAITRDVELWQAMHAPAPFYS